MRAAMGAALLLASAPSWADSPTKVYLICTGKVLAGVAASAPTTMSASVDLVLRTVIADFGGPFVASIGDRKIFFGDDVLGRGEIDRITGRLSFNWNPKIWGDRMEYELTCAPTKKMF